MKHILRRVDAASGMPTVRRGNQICRIHKSFEIITSLRVLFLDWKNTILHSAPMAVFRIWLLKLKDLQKHEKLGP